MGKGDPKRPRGGKSSYAFFVLTCLAEHKKKHPADSVSFSDIPQKCLEKGKTMSAKDRKI